MSKPTFGVLSRRARTRSSSSPADFCPKAPEVPGYHPIVQALCGYRGEIQKQTLMGHFWAVVQVGSGAQS